MLSPLVPSDARVCLGRITRASADMEAWNKYGRTPLHEAAANGHTECVRLLVEAGADVEARDNEGKTPAEHAAESMPVRHAVLEVLGQS